MNRIERLIWEETHIARIARMEREARRTGRAKFVSVVLLVGVVALLASRVSIPPLGETVAQALAPSSLVYTPAPRKSTSDTGSSAATPSQAPADAAGGTGKDDDPRIPTF